MPYCFITLALLFYPAIGWVFIKISRDRPKLKKIVVLIMVILSAVIILCIRFHIITISTALNWFLFTLIYLAISLLVWYAQFQSESTIKIFFNWLLILLLVPGYLVATIGFFFLMIMSEELSPIQKKLIASDLIYMERNIGSGPDPSVRLKKVEVHRKVPWLPIFAYPIKAKTYDTWNVPLKQKLDVSYSKERQVLYLSSVVDGYKIFTWSDTINLSAK